MAGRILGARPGNMITGIILMVGSVFAGQDQNALDVGIAF